jgi:hypothetical protein
MNGLRGMEYTLNIQLRARVDEGNEHRISSRCLVPEEGDCLTRCLHVSDENKARGADLTWI